MSVGVMEDYKLRDLRRDLCSSTPEISLRVTGKKKKPDLRPIAKAEGLLKKTKLCGI
jgi:hypothetical protein